ncbi:MAG: alpha/beta fold hydrolase [Chitinophagaceae bacterium]
MKRLCIFLSFFVWSHINIIAQEKMTPELLWSLGRVSGMGISDDGQWVIYSVSTPDISENKTKRKVFAIPIKGGIPVEIARPDSLLNNDRISPDGKYIISASDVKLKNVQGKEFYPELEKSNAQIYDQLNYRHWDTWEDGTFSHVFVSPITNGNAGLAKDIMPGELFDCPQKPFGGDEDFIWSPDSKKIVYVTKKKYGTAYAISTNTDLYEYNLETGKTQNLTAGMIGYDINPSFNQKGELAWLSMKREGFESDKQDIVVSNGHAKLNLTRQADKIYVEGYRWSEDGKKIFFWSPTNGTQQLFEVNYPGLTKIAPVVKQVTKGDFDITGIIGQTGNILIVTRTDMNHAAELYTLNILNGEMQQLTHVNDSIYRNVNLSKTERRFVKTTDGKNMLVWVIYPPGFDPAKKYPTLLYCQGGPQSALTQFYSYRWNFQLMAAMGYIVVAPNRRGMPGYGTKWNEQISEDHGGQAMRDYLSAIDNISREKFVDRNRLGCVGPSYGGYSVFMLAGIHNNRFKTFISHDGIFDLRSMYGTTEEMWFVNWDYGGPYWDSKNAAAQRSYQQFSPSNLVNRWNTPMLIFHGGKDYRVPEEQGLQAFQALQLKGIKSKLVYFPEENHWVLSAQNALVWQREFFNWLKETL